MGVMRTVFGHGHKTLAGMIFLLLIVTDEQRVPLRKIEENSNHPIKLAQFALWEVRICGAAVRHHLRVAGERDLVG